MPERAGLWLDRQDITSLESTTPPPLCREIIERAILVRVRAGLALAAREAMSERSRGDACDIEGMERLGKAT